MAGQKLVYNMMVEAALRTVVRDVLERLAKDELDKSHHFYITFRTGHKGVSMPDFLFARYPREMTIVLQHQFWDLECGDDGFGVSLSFNDKPERLYVPYEAIKVFADPDAEFGLQFTTGAESEDIGEDEDEAEASETVKLRTKPRAVKAEDPDGNDSKQGEGAEIVTLDRFRKK